LGDRTYTAEAGGDWKMVYRFTRCEKCGGILYSTGKSFISRASGGGGRVYRCAKCNKKERIVEWLFAGG